VGFASSALSWLAIVGLVLFAATGIFGAIKAAEDPIQQGALSGPTSPDANPDR